MRNKETGVMQFVWPAAERGAEDVNGYQRQKNIEPAGVIKKPLHKWRPVRRFQNRGRGQDGNERDYKHDSEGKRAEDFNDNFHGEESLSEMGLFFSSTICYDFLKRANISPGIGK